MSTWPLVSICLFVCRIAPPANTLHIVTLKFVFSTMDGLPTSLNQKRELGKAAPFPYIFSFLVLRESRDGAVVRALASHQCGLGLICRLSLLLFLIHALRGFSPCTQTLSLSSKTNTTVKHLIINLLLQKGSASTAPCY